MDWVGVCRCPMPASRQTANGKRSCKTSRAPDIVKSMVAAIRSRNPVAENAEPAWVPPMPKPAHQRIVQSLLDEMKGFVGPAKLGEALVAPARVRLRPSRFREPDLMLMLTEHAARK